MLHHGASVITDYFEIEKQKAIFVDFVLFTAASLHASTQTFHLKIPFRSKSFCVAKLRNIRDSRNDFIALSSVQKDRKREFNRILFRSSTEMNRFEFHKRSSFYIPKLILDVRCGKSFFGDSKRCCFW